MNNIRFSTDVIALKKIAVDRHLDRISDLSKASGVNRNTLGMILNGKAQPSSDVMYKLISALQIPPEEAGCIFFSSNLHTA